MKRLFLGNVAFQATEDDIKSIFQEAGYEPTQVTVPTDRATRKPRGFAFVEFENAEIATAAREELNGAPLLGRTLRIAPANDPASR